MLSDFACLDIFEEDQLSDREDRKRAAFLRSKANYATELVFTEPEWYDRIEVSQASRRQTDCLLDGLYLRGKYGEALEIALQQIELEDSEESVGKEGRLIRLTDFSIRCALKEENSIVSVRLADKLRGKFHSHPGLAMTSAEAYLMAGRAYDACSAILSAINPRKPLELHLTTLVRALLALCSESSSHSGTSSIQSILQALQSRLRSPIPLLQHSPVAERRTSDDASPAAAPVIDPEMGRQYCAECGFEGADLHTLVSLLTAPAEVDDGSGMRSVKEL